jgi:Tfp pilus assembly protein PilN
MTEDKIKNLLYEADQTAGGPEPVSVDLSAVRRRANRRQTVNLAARIAAAAVVVIALGIWGYTAKKAWDQQRIVALEMQIKQLKAQTDATLNFIREVLDEERKQRRLNELQAQLASIPDPLEEIRKQVDKTAHLSEIKNNQHNNSKGDLI